MTKKIIVVINLIGLGSDNTKLVCSMLAKKAVLELQGRKSRGITCLSPTKHVPLYKCSKLVSKNSCE